MSAAMSEENKPEEKNQPVVVVVGSKLEVTCIKDASTGEYRLMVFDPYRNAVFMADYLDAGDVRYVPYKTKE
jgi:hypothetical protein